MITCTIFFTGRGGYQGRYFVCHSAYLQFWTCLLRMSQLKYNYFRLRSWKLNCTWYPIRKAVTLSILFELWIIMEFMMNQSAVINKSGLICCSAINHVSVEILAYDISQSFITLFFHWCCDSTNLPYNTLIRLMWNDTKLSYPLTLHVVSLIHKCWRISILYDNLCAFCVNRCTAWQVVTFPKQFGRSWRGRSRASLLTQT